MTTTHRLCLDTALLENGTREIEIVLKAERHAGFLLMANKRLICYINSCPHTGATLNWKPNQFLDTNQEFIQCSLHGALFEKSSGLCIWGPCVGMKLQSLAVQPGPDGEWYLVDDAVSSVHIQTGYSDNSVGK